MRNNGADIALLVGVATFAVLLMLPISALLGWEVGIWLFGWLTVLFGPFLAAIAVIALLKSGKVFSQRQRDKAQGTRAWRVVFCLMIFGGALVAVAALGAGYTFVSDHIAQVDAGLTDETPSFSLMLAFIFLNPLTVGPAGILLLGHLLRRWALIREEP